MMPRLKATQLDGYGDNVILIESPAHAQTGRVVYSVFDSEEDARADDSASRVVAILSDELLTAEQRATAAGNAKALRQA